MIFSEYSSFLQTKIDVHDIKIRCQQKCQKYLFINVWRKSVFDIYFTECIALLKDFLNKGNNKITELRAILQRESQNS
jgi:hypothetical protein